MLPCQLPIIDGVGAVHTAGGLAGRGGALRFFLLATGIDFEEDKVKVGGLHEHVNGTAVAWLPPSILCVQQLHVVRASHLLYHQSIDEHQQAIYFSCTPGWHSYVRAHELALNNQPQQSCGTCSISHDQTTFRTLRAAYGSLWLILSCLCQLLHSWTRPGAVSRAQAVGLGYYGSPSLNGERGMEGMLHVPSTAAKMFILLLCTIPASTAMPP